MESERGIQMRFEAVKIKARAAEVRVKQCEAASPDVKDTLQEQARILDECEAEMRAC